LKDLVELYGIRVPQERTIQVYEKWQDLKKLNDKLPADAKLSVVGIDVQVNYKYVSKHILELIAASENEREALQEIREMVSIDTTGYGLGDLSYAYKILKSFVTDYENNKSAYTKLITAKPAFEHIIKNLKISFDFSNQFRDRDKIMLDNYLSLDAIYNFKKQIN